MGLPYIDQLPELPDEAMVERLSRGEWAVQCDDPWQFCVVQVPVFVWTVSKSLPIPNRSCDDTTTLPFCPDTQNRYTASEMAHELSFHLDVEVSADEVYKLAAIGHTSKADVDAAWQQLMRDAHAAQYTIAIERV